MTISIQNAVARPLTAVAALSVLALSAGAQQPIDPGQVLNGENESLADACGVSVLPDGQVWGVGPDYKAQFDELGMHYTAALGAEVEHNQTLRLSLQSIRRDDSIVLEEPVRSAPQASERDVHYDLPFGIVERYAVRADGVEVSWEFPERPAGHGDLVVRMGLDSTLQVGSVAADGGVPLRVPGRELGIHIGAVTGIDAAGHRVPGITRLSDGSIEFVLPSAFVDAAHYPLVLDPLIGSTLFLSSGGLRVAFPDIAYEAGANRYLAVWQTVFSSTDTDIRGLRIDGSTGQVVGGLLPVTTRLTREDRPTVAALASLDVFVIGWQDGQFPIQQLLLGRAYDPVANRFGADGVFSSIGDHPDLGGSALSTSNDAVVVFTVTNQILGATFTVTPGSLALTTQNPRLLMPGSDPAITKTGGRFAHYAVTALAGSRSFHTVRIDRNVRALNAYGVISRPNPVANIDIAGDGERFLCVFEEKETPTSSLGDVQAMSIRFTADPASTFFANVITVEGDAVDNERQPAVTMANEMFTVAWSERGFGSDFDTRFVNVTPDLQPEICGIVSAIRGDVSEWPAMASRRDGDPNSDRDDGFIVWQRTSSSNNGDIDARRFEVWRGGQITQIAGGCGPSGTVGFNGPFAFGNRDFAITLTGASPSTQLAFLNINFPGAQIIPCGTCNIMLPLLTIGVSGSGGNYSVNIPVECRASLRGFTFDVQFGVVEPSRPCPLIGASWSSIHRLVQDI